MGTRESHKRYVERQKILGLCPHCSNKLEKGKSKCRYHLDKTNEYQKKRTMRIGNKK